MAKKKKADSLKQDELVVPADPATDPSLPVFLSRRLLRNRLYKIRIGSDDIKDGLKSFIEAQFKPGMTWHTFTFNWDISPSNFFKVITVDEWEAEGGKFDMVTGRHYPPAFTKQQ